MSAEAAADLQTQLSALGLTKEQSRVVQVYRGQGCARCMRSGYYERVAIYEYVSFDRGIGELVTQKATMESLQRYAVEHGARTLRADAIEKVLRGITTIEEVYRVAQG